MGAGFVISILSFCRCLQRFCFVLPSKCRYKNLYHNLSPDIVIQVCLYILYIYFLINLVFNIFFGFYLEPHDYQINYLNIDLVVSTEFFGLSHRHLSCETSLVERSKERRLYSQVRESRLQLIQSDISFSFIQPSLCE